jgi:hypothetical protein
MSTPYIYDRPDLVHRAVCEVLCAVFPTLSKEQVLSSERLNHTTAWLRHTGMYVMSRRLGVSQMYTAKWFGRDRTTVTHSVNLAEIEANERPLTSAFFDFLEQQVRLKLDEFAELEEQTGRTVAPIVEREAAYHG